MASAALVTGAPVESAEVRLEPHWSLANRIGFRFAFVYLMLYMFCNGNVTVFAVLQPFPILNDWARVVLFSPLAALTQWWAVRALHLTGMAATWHTDGSGDTLLNYLLCVTFLGIAVVATIAWSILDRRRAQYEKLYAWLRFFLRLNVGMGMLQYGFYKVFPIQMQPPNMAVLNEPVGQMSPLTLLWTLIGLSPWYERVCGAAEVLGGLLILIRPTALAGAMLSAFVMTNVVLYNFFFDVPVKLYAAHVLAMACFVLLPDMTSLWDFFVRQRSARLKGVWVPIAASLRGRTATLAFEWLFLLAVLLSYLKYDGDRYRAYLDGVRKEPIVGLWALDAGGPMPQTVGGVPWTSISIDHLTRGMARSTDGQLWRMYLTYDAKAHTLGMTSRGGGGTVKYTWAIPDAEHLLLTKVGADPVVLHFHRVVTPSEYPLLTRGFHLVSEWGYER